MSIGSFAAWTFQISDTFGLLGHSLTRPGPLGAGSVLFSKPYSYLPSRDLDFVNGVTVFSLVSMDGAKVRCFPSSNVSDIFHYRHLPLSGASLVQQALPASPVSLDERQGVLRIQGRSSRKH